MSLPVEEVSSLPVIDVPLYYLVVPSSGEKITVRPFTVKEEKLLFMAVESEKIDDIVATVKQVINNCVIKGSINIDKLPFFDIDYIFIFLRAKSVGEKQEIKLTCKHKPDGEHECGGVFPAQLDISNIEIVKDEELSNDIKLDAKNGVKMKYPTYSVLKVLENSKTNIDKKTALIVTCIDYIYDGKQMFSSKDRTKGELTKWVEDLTEEKYKKLENWVDNFPTFVVIVDVTCTKCGFEHHVRYSDFYDFFY